MGTNIQLWAGELLPGMLPPIPLFDIFYFFKKQLFFRIFYCLHFMVIITRADATKDGNCFFGREQFVAPAESEQTLI